MKRYPGFSRLLAFLLALVLVMSSSASVFAAEETAPYLPVVTPLLPDAALDNVQKNDLMTIAYNYDDIPDEMMDNTILRALEYTGYNVQYQKDRQTAPAQKGRFWSVHSDFPKKRKAPQGCPCHFRNGCT